MEISFPKTALVFSIANVGATYSGSHNLPLSSILMDICENKGSEFYHKMKDLRLTAWGALSGEIERCAATRAQGHYWDADNDSWLTADSIKISREIPSQQLRRLNTKTMAKNRSRSKLRPTTGCKDHRKFRKV